MQFKVPQNIDMADRIVGPLTLIQFLYLLVGGIIIYFLLNTVAPVNNVLFMALSLPIGFFSIAMAFLKVQDQPFPRFVAAFFIFLFKPKTRVWVKDGVSTNVVIVPDAPDASKQAVHRKSVKRAEIEQLVHTLDSGGHLPPPSAPPKSQAASPPNYLRRGRPVLDGMKH